MEGIKMFRCCHFKTIFDGDDDGGSKQQTKNKKVSLEEQQQQFPFFSFGYELFYFTSADADISFATFHIKKRRRLIQKS